MNDGKSKTQHLFWRELQRKTVYQGSIFSLLELRRRSTDGRQGDFLLIDAPDWVTVVPVIEGEDGEETFLMVS
ncbi:MAG TPA: NUDIX hydrolase, partial [Sediminispirochaeta sp.]|nr:NUDIX hydrolase [Sediminispirochaeta sp.]